MIRVAVVGVGNCASALVQGVTAMRQSKPIVGGVLGSNNVGKYGIADIEVVAAFDVNEDKIGKDLAQAILVEPNCASHLTDVPETGVKVSRGPIFDGLDSDIAKYIKHDRLLSPCSVRDVLTESGAEILVNFLPSGSVDATYHYVSTAIKAGLGVVNAIPVAVANSQSIRELADANGVPIIGDDIKSQVGATIIHRAVGDLFPLRGSVLDRTIQLDWGGDMDFANLTSNGRYEHGKRRSKTESVIASHPNKETIEVNVAAVQYIPFLKNTKEAYFRLEGRIFGNMPVNIQMFMSVEDSYDSAGIVADAVRCAKIALDRKESGVIEACSAFFCKWPPKQIPDAEAYDLVRKYID